MITRVDPRHPAGRMIVPVPETRRRHNHLKLVADTHPMLSIALECLKDLDTERPSSQQICHHLSALKESDEYRKSKEVSDAGDENSGRLQEKEELIAQLKQDRENKEEMIEELRSDLLQKEQEEMQSKR